MEEPKEAPPRIEIVEDPPAPIVQPTIEAVVQEPELELPEISDELVRDIYQDNELEAEIAHLLNAEYAEETAEEVEIGQPIEMAREPRSLASEVPAATTELAWQITNNDNIEDAPEQEQFERADLETDEHSEEPGRSLEIGDMRLPVVEVSHTATKTAVQAWEQMLRSEPAQLYEHFAHLLEVFAENAVEQIVDIESGNEQLVPPIVTTLIERLAELDVEQKETVTVAMQDVIGALHGIQVLEMRGAAPEVIEPVERQLIQLTVALFESLDMEYTERDIDDFIAALRSPRFMPEAAVEGSVDTKDLGTHEAKYFAQMVSTIADAESHIQHALGMFVLFNLGLKAGSKEAA